APKDPIDWVWGHSLTRGRPTLLPAAILFLDQEEVRPFRFRGSGFLLPYRGSNGLAAGSNLEDALLQAMLQVVERDAALHAFRTARSCPKLELREATRRDSACSRIVVALEKAGFDVFGRDLTHDIPIPTVEVYLRSRDPYGIYLISGYGTHPDPYIAI